MTKALQMLALTGLVVIGGCRRDHAPREQQQPNYETVQEGEAAGVTSTIHGPGETTPPITGTNADTTSAFTINPALATGPATPPGTLAGTLPNQPYGGVAGMPAYVPPPRPMTTQPARTQPPATQPPPATTTTAEPQPEPEQTETAPPPTQTQTDAPTPPEEKSETREKTDTTSTTSTAPPPPPPPPPAAASW